MELASSLKATSRTGEEATVVQNHCLVENSTEVKSETRNSFCEDTSRIDKVIVTLDKCNNLDSSTATKLNMPRNASSPLLNRKHKPPDLELTDSNPSLDQSSSASDCLDDETEQQPVLLGRNSYSDEPESPSTPLVTLPKRMIKVMDAGLSSPIVRRSSRIEEILNLPDVKAALVHDEGLELRGIFQNNTGKPDLTERLQTPGDMTREEQFKFESESPAESESVSGSDASSVLSIRDTIVENNAKIVDDVKADLRPRIGVLQDAKAVSNPLDRIADSLAPSTLFKNTAKKDQTPSPKLSKKEKKRNRSKSQEQDGSTNSSDKPTPLLSRFKFSSMRETRSRLEGWDSLSRALARVGAATPHISVDDIDLHPKLNPILKRSLRDIGSTEKDGVFLQVLDFVFVNLLSH